ncbi:hypothetical protein D3C81_1193630 [compost metagenome]
MDFLYRHPLCRRCVLAGANDVEVIKQFGRGLRGQQDVQSVRLVVEHIATHFQVTFVPWNVVDGHFHCHGIVVAISHLS